MTEYIDRERLKQCFHANVCGGNAYDELIDMQPTADVIERSKIDKAIKEMNSMPLGLVMDCDEMRDYCVEILKRNIGEE